MGILLCYDVTDEKSFNSTLLSLLPRYLSSVCGTTPPSPRVYPAFLPPYLYGPLATHPDPHLTNRPSLFRHKNLVLERRATRLRRRQQDPHRQQMRLGREARRVHGARPGPRRRIGDPVSRGFSKEQY